MAEGIHDTRDYDLAAESFALARSFRLYHKKRGNRRTGSPQLGSVGEAAFWAVLLLLGCGGTVLLFFNLVVPEWRVNTSLSRPPARCSTSGSTKRQGDDGPLYRPEIWIEYEVGVETYGNWHYDIHRAYSSGRQKRPGGARSLHAEGNRYPCWYDPTNPYVVVLVRRISLVGLAGVHRAGVVRGYRRRRTAVHAAALGEVGRASFGPDAAGTRAGFFWVGQRTAILSRRSTRRRHDQQPRHQASLPSAHRLLARLGLVRHAGLLRDRGTAPWHLRHLLSATRWPAAPAGLWRIFVPLVLIGLGAIAIFVRQLLIATGIGPTLLEISDHPLQPGGRYRLFLSQSGRLSINALRLSLVCEETAIYRQGTNTRTETDEVCRHEIFRREAICIRKRAALRDGTGIGCAGRGHALLQGRT